MQRLLTTYYLGTPYFLISAHFTARKHGRRILSWIDSVAMSAAVWAYLMQRRWRHHRSERTSGDNSIMPTATTTNVAYTASAQTTQGFSLSTRPTVSRGDIPVTVNRLERSWKRQLLRKKVTFIVPLLFVLRLIIVRAYAYF